MMIGLISLLVANAFAQTPATENGMEAILTEEAIRAIRDPFRAPNIQFSNSEDPEKKKTDLETFTIRDMRLNGVLTGGKKSRALLSLPNAKTVFVSVGDKIGLREGHVTGISGDSLSVIEYDYDENGKKIPERFRMLISGELISLDKKGDL